MSTFAAGALVGRPGVRWPPSAGLPRRGARRDGHVRHRRPAARSMVRGGPAGAPHADAVGARPDESLARWFDDDGRYHLRGELDADHGRIVDAALTEARDALFRSGQTDVTWAEAIVEMAQRSLDGAPAERRERVPGQLVHRPQRPGAGPLDRRPGRARLAARPTALRRHRAGSTFSSRTLDRSAWMVAASGDRQRTRRIVEHRTARAASRAPRPAGCRSTDLVHHGREMPADTWNPCAIVPPTTAGTHPWPAGIGNADARTS